MANEASARGHAAHIAGKYTDAINHYTEAINRATNYSEAAAHYSNRSNAYYQLKQYSNALTDAKKSVELDPKGYFGYRSQGAVYCALEQYEEALSTYKKGLEFYPLDIWFRYYVADLHVKLTEEKDLIAAKINKDETMEEIE